MLDVAPGGDLGPLAAHWAQALTAEMAHAVLQRKQGENVLKVEIIDFGKKANFLKIIKIFQRL